MLEVLTLVIGERLRQNALVESGDLPFSCAWKGNSGFDKLPVLMEEVGEVAKALYEIRWEPSRNQIQREHLRTELIQTAAVALAWAESLAPK